MKKHYYLKFAVMALVAVFIWAATPQSAYAQSKKQIKKDEKQYELDVRKAELDKKRTELEKQKARDNQYQDKVSFYENNGYRISGGSRTLKVALLDHYEKTGGDPTREITGIVTSCQSINLCQTRALNNAANRYATQASINVKGKLGTALDHSERLKQAEVDNFSAMYASKVEGEVGGVLTDSYSVIKENGDGTNRYETVFIIDQEKLASARRRAMEQTLLENKIIGLKIDEIFKIVEEEVKVD